MGVWSQTATYKVMQVPMLSQRQVFTYMVRSAVNRNLKFVQRALILSEAKPLTFGVLVSGILGVSGDAVAQKCYNREFHLRRNIAFGIHGLLYIGVVQYLLWARLFPMIIRRLPRQVARYQTSTMVAMDMALHIPFLYFPVFYILKELIVNHGKLNTDMLGSVYRTWRSNLWEDLGITWTVWGPVQCVTFSIIPMHLRVPFVSVVNFMWTCILSSMRGA